MTPEAATFSPTQARSILDAKGRVNLWHGSVSSGKTVASIVAWLDFVANDAPQGELFMIGRTLDTLYRNVLKPAIEMFPANACPIKYTRGATTATIFGREVAILGANDARSETRIRGATAAGAYVDEITLLPDLAYWLQLMNRLRVEGSRMFGTTNPDGPLHWLKTEVLDKAAELGYRVCHFTLDDNPALPAWYVDQIKRENVGLWYERNIEGKWVMAEGRIWDMWDEDVHVVELLPKMTEYLVSGDYGTAGVTAFGLWGHGRDDRMYLISEFRWDARKRQHQLTDVELSRRLREWLMSNAEQHPGCLTPWRTEVDPSAVSLIVQLRADGWPSVRGAYNGVQDGLRWVASLLAADRLRIHTSCTGLRHEIPGYVWDPKALERDGKEQPVKANDHSCDMARYAVAGAWSWWRGWVTVDATAAEAA